MDRHHIDQCIDAVLRQTADEIDFHIVIPACRHFYLAAGHDAADLQAAAVEHSWILKWREWRLAKLEHELRLAAGYRLH